MAALDFFLNLITSEYRNKPKFSAWASVLFQGLVDAQNTAAKLPTTFDLDTAVGDQLDMVGEWIGATRFIAELIPIFFSWNVPGLGWSQAPWIGPFSPPGFQGISLDDYHYRILLKARVAANNWDGTIEGSYAAWRDLFALEGFQVLIQNVGPKAPTFQRWFTWQTFGLGWGEGAWFAPHQRGPGPYTSDDMRIILALVGPAVDPLTKALFNGGHLDMRPAGVQIDAYVTQTIAGRPLFAWGTGPTVSGDYTAPPVNLAGWGMGAWGDFSVRPAPIVTPATVTSNTLSTVEGRLTRVRDAIAAMEIPQGIGSVVLQFTTFFGNIPNGAVTIIKVTMWPPTPEFAGTLTLSGTNSGGFVLSTVDSSHYLLRQSTGGTAPGTYTDVILTASQVGMKSISLSPVLVGS
jgi:hypothetical protein